MALACDVQNGLHLHICSDFPGMTRLFEVPQDPHLFMSNPHLL
jgi:hypothetical protein